MIRFWFSKDFMTGGNIYNRMVFDVLRQRGYNPVEEHAYTPYHGRGYTYLNALYTYFTKTSRPGDIDIMDYSAAAWSSARVRGQRIVIMFHFDPGETRKKRKHRFFFHRFLKQARGAKVIVISQYWKHFLEELGLHNIEVIYCAYDVEKYKPYLSKEEFLRKYSLPSKPIIYLGKNSIPKTFNVYRILEPLADDCLLITSGLAREFPGPVHLDLDFEGYCSLLYAAGVTVTMPQFAEGWSRIAHESLICGTPVIGNGKGGMKELLERTHQLVITENEPGRLITAVKDIVAAGKRVDAADCQYAKSFDLNYFGMQWEKVVRGALFEKTAPLQPPTKAFDKGDKNL